MKAWCLCACLWLAAAPAWASRAENSADYWRLLPYYRPQITDSACSVASVAMALAALGAGGVDQASLLVTDVRWRQETAAGGEGVTFADLLRHLHAALDQAGMADASVTVFQPVNAAPGDLARLRALLTAAAGNGRDVVIVSFDQGWLWGEPSVGHVSPVGDYDPANGRVLLMDVDGDHFGPLWLDDTDLLRAMTRPDTDDPDGIILIRRAHP